MYRIIGSTVIGVTAGMISFSGVRYVLNKNIGNQ